MIDVLWAIAVTTVMLSVIGVIGYLLAKLMKRMGIRINDENDL